MDKIIDFYFNTPGLKPNLSNLGIDSSKLAEMAENICHNNDLPDVSFKVLSQQDIENIYRMCLV